MTETKEKSGHQGIEGGGKQPVQADEEALRLILHNGDVKTLVELAKVIGGNLKNKGLSTSQVRGFFAKVREIEAKEQARKGEERLSDDTYRELILLKPKLAYQAERTKQNTNSEGVAELQKVLGPAIDLVETDPERFRNFVDFFEAILAYHRAAGGK